jgi:antitoxin YefM
MTAITFSSARAEFARTIEQAVNDHTPVLITRRKGGNAVIISEEDFRSYEETAYLMQSLNNAMRLNSAIASLRNGKGIEKTLVEI